MASKFCAQQPADRGLERRGLRRRSHRSDSRERGTSADDQLKVYEATGGDFNAVVDMLMINTLENVPEDCF